MEIKESEKARLACTCQIPEPEDYRQITEREIFEDVYLAQWHSCFEMASKELADSGVAYSMTDILSLTATLHITWCQQQNRIVMEKDKRQEALNKRGK
jgi:hypothetical protein